MKSKRSNGFKTAGLMLGLSVAIYVFSIAAPLLLSGNPIAVSQAAGLSRAHDLQLLDHFLNSEDLQPTDNLFRAAFALGPAITPKLKAALAEDRTAQFAAQSLAFIGGPKAHAVLAALVNGHRDLDLVRFYYGSLAEYHDPADTAILLNVIRQADAENDRMVVESAILALSVRSDPSLASKLRALEKDVHDYVLQDDIETAATVIKLRSKYLASPKATNHDASIEQAIRTYFIPALEGPPPEESAGQPDASPDIHIEQVTISPDKDRALVHVIFETPEALAHYRIVVQRQKGKWTIASAWLGAETEKNPAPAKQK